MDRTADPCVDFYQYTCGGWMKKNPIPSDQPRWSVYAKLDQDNQRFLWGILDDLAKNTSGRNPNQQKIGDYFAACMDEPAIEKLGAAPLKPYLDQINGLTSKKQLPALLAEIHLRTDKQRHLLRLWLKPGLWRLIAGDRLCHSRRARPSGPRLLHQERSEFSGFAPEVCRSCAADARTAG